ncbi:MAG: NYN domain-containing protein [Asgard group archaeon]|nr:NYN domain-containing protein [Asgard group archaeon]
MSELVEEEAELINEKSLYDRISERIFSSSHIQALRARITGEKRIAIFVDGPNFLRKIGDRQIKLEDIDEQVKNLGRPVFRKVILNEHAGQKLIQAITNSGYEPIVTPHDTHIFLSIEIMDAIEDSRKVDVIVIASRHARINPILMKIKEKGIETAVVGFEPGFSIAIQKSADNCFVIK